MEDNPIVFLKRVMVITLGLAVVLAGVMYFSGPKTVSDNDTERDSNTPEVSINSSIDTQQTPASQTKAPTSLSLSNTLIRKAETVPPEIGAVISYDNTGFHPAEFRVKAGTSVRFINKSTRTMLVSSVYKDGARTYPEFEQRSSAGRGGYFDFNFSKKGEWGFSNVNAPNDYGLVIVE